MVNNAHFKLGRRPTRFGVRRLRLRDYLDYSALPPIPASIDYTTKVSAWPMFLNDQLGDCVEAAAAHLTELWSMDATGSETAVTDQQVEQAYSQAGGYVPGNPNTDQGTDMTVFVGQWKQSPGFYGNVIAGEVTVDVTDPREVAVAIYLFGGLFTAVDLPISAQGQTTWDVPPGGPTGDGAPGSWGGHCIPTPAYSSITGPYKVITWGTIYAMTQAFLATYGVSEETYALISNDWFNGQKVAPNGLNLVQLQADLAELNNPSPNPTPQPTPTSTSLVVSPNPAQVGAPISVAVSVTGTGSTPTGLVFLVVDGMPSATSAPLSASGSAAFTETYARAGTHSITAAYSGDANNAASSSAAVSLVVQAPAPPQPSIQATLDAFKADFDYADSDYSTDPAGAIAFFERAGDSAEQWAQYFRAQAAALRG